ncbi:MAG: CpsD/CapB family tyrosine-protein kinase [Acidobacteriota bacterium]
MGRIYKALAKDWKERQQQAQKIESFDNPSSLRDESLASEETLNGREDYRFAGFGFGHSTMSRVVEFQSPATPKPAITEDEVVNLLETVLEESVQTSRPDTQRHLTVAPKAPAAKVFSEPQHLVGLNALAVEPPLVALTNSDATAVESYRTLAVRLLNMTSNKNKKLKTLLVTSAESGEGKTIIATNLAWVMAKQSERRVLLLDANLQNPSVYDKLGVVTQSGWLDIIDQQAEFTTAATRLDPNGLYLLSPGKNQSSVNVEASNTITSERGKKFFEELADYFDFIVIDAPAILESADAQSLVAVADAAVMVTRAGHTPHQRVTEALKFIPKEQRVGVVLNEIQFNEESTSRKKRKTGSR